MMMMWLTCVCLQATTRSTSSTVVDRSQEVHSSVACPTALRSPSPTSATSRAAERPSNSTVSCRHGRENEALNRCLMGNGNRIVTTWAQTKNKIRWNLHVFFLQDKIRLVRSEQLSVERRIRYVAFKLACHPSLLLNCHCVGLCVWHFVRLLTSSLLYEVSKFAPGESESEVLVGVLFSLRFVCLSVC